MAIGVTGSTRRETKAVSRLGSQFEAGIANKVNSIIHFLIFCIMQNFIFIAAANETIKGVGQSLRSGNTLYTSLSSVLKDIQRRDSMRAGYSEVFAALGLRVDGKFTPAEFMTRMEPEQFKEVKVGGKTEKRLGLWGFRQAVDSDGNKLFDEGKDGGPTPRMEPVLRTVTGWSPNKLFKALAQASAIAASKKAK